MAGIHFTEIEFADGTKVSMKSGDILVLTGSNNAGKSTVLRNLRTRLLILDDKSPSQTIKSTKTQRRGSMAELKEELKKYYVLEHENSEEADQISICKPISVSFSEEQWKEKMLRAEALSIFATLLTARQRFALIEDAALTSYDEAVSPIQKLRYAEDIEKNIGAIIKRAFGGVEVLCHGEGQTLQFKIGKREQFPSKEDYKTKNEHLKGRNLPLLREEGDGLQSFAGIVIAILAAPKSLILVDEPEAFLHPPQARRLAQDLAENVPTTAQLIVATHDYDFLRGLVAAGGGRVHVVRIRRADGATITKHLSNEDLKELWKDPLLYTSDLLSALFHDVAVICEGESDVRFLRAMLAPFIHEAV